jgi:hypothetical protein
MWELKTITDSRGREVHVCFDKRTQETWYCQDGGKGANLTYQEIEEGDDIEVLDDMDSFTVYEPIISPEQILNYLEE